MYWLKNGDVLRKHWSNTVASPSYGFAVNVGALLFLVPTVIFSFFPLATPVVASTMNWGVVIYSGIIIFATVYYFLYARHVYVPPVALVKRDL